MEYPLYIFSQRGQSMLHWSGPWDTPDAFNEALSKAKAAHPGREFHVCGSSVTTIDGADIGGGGFVKFSVPSNRIGPKLSELEAAHA